MGDAALEFFAARIDESLDGNKIFSRSRFLSIASDAARATATAMTMNIPYHSQGIVYSKIEARLNAIARQLVPEESTAVVVSSIRRRLQRLMEDEMEDDMDREYETDDEYDTDDDMDQEYDTDDDTDDEIDEMASDDERVVGTVVYKKARAGRSPTYGIKYWFDRSVRTYELRSNTKYVVGDAVYVIMNPRSPGNVLRISSPISKSARATGKILKMSPSKQKLSDGMITISYKFKGKPMVRNLVMRKNTLRSLGLTSGQENVGKMISLVLDERTGKIAFMYKPSTSSPVPSAPSAPSRLQVSGKITRFNSVEVTSNGMPMPGTNGSYTISYKFKGKPRTYDYIDVVAPESAKRTKKLGLGGGKKDVGRTVVLILGESGNVLEIKSVGKRVPVAAKPKPAAAKPKPAAAKPKPAAAKPKPAIKPERAPAPNPLNNITIPPLPPPQPPYFPIDKPVAREEPEEKTSIFSKWWFWLIAAVLAIAVGYGGYLVYKRFNRPEAVESADMDIINMSASNGDVGEMPENGDMGGEFPENGGMGGEFPVNERNYGNEFGNYGNQVGTEDYFYENIENFGGDGIATELPDTMSLQKK